MSKDVYFVVRTEEEYSNVELFGSWDNWSVGISTEQFTKPYFGEYHSTTTMHRGDMVTFHGKN